MCNALVNGLSICPQQGLKSKPWSDFGDKTLHNKTAKKCEREAAVQNRELKGINNITNT